MNNNTELVYKEIITKVCGLLKEDFLEEGVSENIINDLKNLWYNKLVLSGVIHNLKKKQNQVSSQPNFIFPFNYDPQVAEVGVNTINFKSHPGLTTSENIRLFHEMNKKSKEITRNKETVNYVTKEVI